jgi:short-subunit dehydrogenase
MRLAGKTAAITGASSGIGAALARALCEAGAAVIGLARRGQKLSKVEPASGKMIDLSVDITDTAAVERCFARLGPVDILVHSAGVAHFARAAELDEGELRAMLEVHVVGAAACTRAALPGLRKRQGQVLFISSVATRIDLPECSGYAAAKYAQLGYARALAAEEREHGVRVTTAIVGATNTALWQTRPQFDTKVMAEAEHMAEALVTIIGDREVVIDEIVVTPPRGIL